MTLPARMLGPVVAVREVFANPNLRRLQLAYAGSITGEWAFAVAIAIYVYHRGGAGAVGLLALVRMLPAAIVSPFTALFGDRHDRKRVMITADLARATATAAAAVVALSQGPALLIYALAVVISLVSTTFRPAQGAIIPTLARTPEELTASNVVSSSIEGTGSFAGPAVGGLLAAATSSGVVFAAVTGAFLWSAALVARINVDAGARRDTEASRGIGHELFAGFRAILGEGHLRLLVGLYAAQTLVAGALNVLIVVMAFRLLDLGSTGVGFLSSATGIGGLVGAAAALVLVGRRRLASGFGLGVVMWGLPIALIAAWPNAAFALLMLGVVGVGNTIVDVAAFTLLQRTVADRVLARVFGVLECLFLATVGLGGLLAPVLVSALGVRGALLATGVFLPALTLLFSTRLTAMDASAVAPERELALLRAIPLFAPLSSVTLEQLAGSMTSVPFGPGSVVVRQGDPGTQFYVVAEGTLDVDVGGHGAPSLGPGQYFGEIALLRDVPRTATVTARTDVELYALERDEFISAVTGHPESLRSADAVIGARLGGLRSSVASV